MNLAKSFFLATIAVLTIGVLNGQAPTISSFAPVSQVSGKNVIITGTNFSNASDVKFGGVSASNFTVNSSTQITATVPTSAVTGDISVLVPSQTTATLSGFIYLVQISELHTDFGGYWKSTLSNNNTTLPNLSHNVLAFEYDGTVYSTGVNDAELTNQSVTYTAGEWNAFPISTVSGTGTSAVLLWASKNDGSLKNAVNPKKKINEALIDGINGLDIGTGIADFSSSSLEFEIASVNSSKINDSEPDILITQIANPATLYDEFWFEDGNGTIIGNKISAISKDISILGKYLVDQWFFSVKGTAGLNDTTTSSTIFLTNNTKDIRLFAYKLSDFGITTSNYSNIQKLFYTASGKSDIGFVAYNSNSIIIPTPNISQQPTSVIECTGQNNSVTFSTTASNISGFTSTTITYQWKKNGQDISGGTSSSYTINNVTSNDAGEYICVITNDYGTIYSDPAYLNSYFKGELQDYTVCRNSSFDLAVETGGFTPTYQWYSNTTASNSGGTAITGATSASYSIPTTSSGTFYYYCIITTPNNLGCAIELTSAVSTITIPSTYTWEGDISTSFNNDSNWVEGCVPGNGADISFRTTSAPDRICELNISPTLGDISINGTGSTYILDLNNQTLTVQGDLTLSGNNIDARDSNSTINMNGSASQTIPSSSFVDDQAANIVIQNSSGVTAGGTIDITRSLEMVTGTLTTGNYITFKSSADYTAVLKQVPSSGTSISGNVTVEKYVKAKRAFRLMGPTVTTSTPIRSNWQEGTNIWFNNPNPGYGTHITGSQTASNGFDQTHTGDPSLFTFNNSTQNWSSISNTNTNTLVVGTPYRLMIRGGRNINVYQADNNPTPTNTILRANGTIYTGDYTVSNLSGTANATNFVANPYQAVVDLSSVLTSSNSNLKYNTVYMWDPFINTRGAWATVTINTNDVTPTTSEASKYLQPGQAFFVNTASSPTGTPSITFSESDKTTSQGYTTSNLLETVELPYDNVQITLINTDSMVICDGVEMRFNSEYIDTITDFDAVHFDNLDENLFINEFTQPLTIDCRTSPTSRTEFSLGINQFRATNYAIRLKKSNWNNGLNTYLWDKYTSKIIEVKNGDEIDYGFSIDSNDLNSISLERFVIVFAEQADQVNKSEKLNRNKVKIYPNPNNGKSISISGLPISNNNIEISLIDASGRIIENQNYKNGSLGTIQFSPNKILSNGLYYIKIESSNYSEMLSIQIQN